MTAVARALADRDVTRLVVGLPLHADGRESEMSEEARGFGTRVGAAMQRDVVWFDETLTSWEAEETVKASGKSLRDARLRGDIDRAAAVSILRSYLQALEAEARPRCPTSSRSRTPRSRRSVGNRGSRPVLRPADAPRPLMRSVSPSLAPRRRPGIRDRGRARRATLPGFERTNHRPRRPRIWLGRTSRLERW